MLDDDICQESPLMWKSIVLAAGLGLLTTACSSTYATRPVTRSATLAPAAAPVVTAGVRITLSADQAASVRAYLGTTSSAPQNGRGRGRNGGLPPGIAKNLERGKPLPPGIAKSYLPAHVVAGLPRLPSGLDYVVVAGKLLLVEAATAAIHDVLLDVAFDR
jgi:hypothetical protein